MEIYPPNKGMMVVNNPLLRPYFLGGCHWGITLRFPFFFHHWSARARPLTNETLRNNGFLIVGQKLRETQWFS